jgi:hypothetical protein
MQISAWQLHQKLPAGNYAFGEDRKIVIKVDNDGVFLLSDETAATFPLYAFANRIKPQ